MLRSRRKFGTVMSVNSMPKPVAGRTLRTTPRTRVVSPISSVRSISLPVGTDRVVSTKQPFRLIALTIPARLELEPATIRAGIRQLKRLKVLLSSWFSRTEILFYFRRLILHSFWSTGRSFGLAALIVNRLRNCLRTGIKAPVTINTVKRIQPE